MDICCRPSVPRGLGKERVEASYSCISLDRLEGAESLSEHSCRSMCCKLQLSQPRGLGKNTAQGFCVTIDSLVVSVPNKEMKPQSLATFLTTKSHHLIPLVSGF